MKEYGLILLFVFLFLIHGLAQNDTLVNKLNDVEVIAHPENKIVHSSVPVRIMNKEQLNELPALHLSDALKFTSGIVIKDYGGTGGLKTVAVRGFGAQHTAVSYDGIAMTDCQTGQIDLGKISLNHVENVSLLSGDGDDIFIPARLLSSASTIRIQSKKPYFSDNKPVNLSVEFSGGSFGLISPTIGMENRIRKKKSGKGTALSSSVLFHYLQSKGDYPYTLYYGNNGDSTSRERRQNSDIRSLSAEANLFADFKDNSALHAKFFYYHSQRGLPGATVLYNPSSSQRLWDENLFAQIRYEKHFTRKFAYQVNAKYNYGYQRYLDPDYLNIEQKLDNRYVQREAYLSHVFLYNIHKIIRVAFSGDVIYNTMNSNSRDFPFPARVTSLSALSSHVKTRHVSLNAGLLYTYVWNYVKYGDPGGNRGKFSPSLSISFRPLPAEEWHMRFFYKNIFRLPTFNDLYYREVGNTGLNPENTHQINGGMTYSRFFAKKRIGISFAGDIYYNIVKDKIVAIPTKNLFVWSMLNFGRVEIWGIDIHTHFTYRIIKQLKIEWTGNYTFQRALDKTDPGSKTYLHQIPYTPLHSGSSIVTAKTPWFDILFSILLSGKRYALQQNISSNLLEPYTDMSLAISKEFRLKKVSLALKAELLNIADRHYEIVRNFPMQGRSFRVTVRCSF